MDFTAGDLGTLDNLSDAFTRIPEVLSGSGARDAGSNLVSAVEILSNLFCRRDITYELKQHSASV